MQNPTEIPQQYLDGEGKEVDLFQRLDFHVLDQAAKLGDRNPLQKGNQAVKAILKSDSTPYPQAKSSAVLSEGHRVMHAGVLSSDKTAVVACTCSAVLYLLIFNIYFQYNN